ncbi:DUF302 domain-containing protein [Pontibacter sp. JAM-7]|uniref:DUF302 domain-containing protein n=1 Tax=Pontibacter sp. JAM-7 TaxID=3366581 RepID=UPI003AF9AE0D
MKGLLLVALCWVVTWPLSAAEGVIDVKSAFGVEETADRLQTVLKQKGMKLFARINHAQGAASVGLSLRDTELLLFGNPKVGSPLMRCEQSVALDLPQKALIWQDENAQVWISYNDPGYLQSRHAISGCDEVLAKVEKALAAFVQAAAGEDM